MPRGDEHAARIRAARAYADLDRIEFGESIGFSKETVSRLESGERSGDDPVLLAKIARACGVPLQFMETGFAPLERPISDVERRVYEIETGLGARVAGLEKALSRLPEYDDQQERAALEGDLEERALQSERTAAERAQRKPGQPRAAPGSQRPQLDP